MKPCAMDLQFWAARTAPSWARTMLKYPPNPGPLLHAAINFRASVAHMTEAARHTQPGTRIRLHKHKEGRESNAALAVLRMVRKRGEPLRAYMIDAARKYEGLQPERATTYRRWLRRMVSAADRCALPQSWP